MRKAILLLVIALVLVAIVSVEWVRVEVSWRWVAV